MFAYSAYNLKISSEIPLPELRISEGPADVVVRFGNIGRDFGESGKQVVVDATAGEVCLFFGRIATFLVREGREILVDPVSGVDERWLRIGILGPSLGALLHQRGWLTLHASSVAVGGAAVAFMGERGWGKSTMAATMCDRGHLLVADDVTAARVEDGAYPTVYPGYPQLKLWPDAAASLGEDPETLPRLDPVSMRRARRAVENFSAGPLPLRRVYVLGEGEKSEIVPLRPQEALMQLIGHTYGRQLFQDVGTRTHFLKCASVAGSVEIRNLNRPRDLSELSNLARLVEEDLTREMEQDAV